MSTHDHSHDAHGAPAHGSFWTSRAFIACAIFLVIGLVLLWTEHLAHALGYLPYLLILACPLMHMFMHGGHGGHGDSHQRLANRKPNASDGEAP